MREILDNLKKSRVEVPLDSHLQLCKSILEWLLSYKVTSSNLEERVTNQCQNKSHKDFMAQTGFVRSLFKVKNK